ncbi:hypothetical protein D3C86_1016560 [compost metagenome]
MIQGRSASQTEIKCGYRRRRQVRHTLLSDWILKIQKLRGWDVYLIIGRIKPMPETRERWTNGWMLNTLVLKSSQTFH